MKTLLPSTLLIPFLLTAQHAAAQQPDAPQPQTVSQATSPAIQPTDSSPAASSNDTAIPLTRAEAEQMALRNNPRITASKLLALASGQLTREARSAEMPQVEANLTAVQAEDSSRVGSGLLTSSRLYTHAGAGGTLSQLITDFGHTQNLVANAQLLQKAQQQQAQATQQDVLLATDQAFYRLMEAQSLLEVARVTVDTRKNVQTLIGALTHSALKSDLDLSIASADLSQAQLMQLDAENAVASASATLAALLGARPATVYSAVHRDDLAPPLPPESSAPLVQQALAQRPDLQAVQSTAEAEHRMVRADQTSQLPTLTAMATGGSVPVRPDGNVFTHNWYGAAGVNLSIPLFTGFRLNAQTEASRLREHSEREQSRDLSNNIARDVQIATLAAQTAFRKIAVTQQFKTQAQQSLGLAETRYKLGLSSIVELSQAQLQSTQANVDEVNARYGYLLALRNLEYAKGTLAP
ncbi:MAG: TolC family protein [Acidobacteriaceae bacterium]|nr:TolC family protein [Acidobacteriaceae bacterium]